MMLKMSLIECSSLPQDGPAALEAIKRLRSCGATMLTLPYGFVEKKPEKRIDSKGNIIVGLGVEHPALAKGCYHYQKTLAPLREHGTGYFCFIHSDRWFTFTQDLKENDPSHWDEIAARLLPFLRMIYPHLRPRFGWIDESGYLEVHHVLVKNQPRLLFWANLFGPDLVQQLGKDFLLRAPGWKKEELDDGGILYVVESKYHEWYANPSKQALRYFQKKIPEIRVYRAKPADLPDEIARMVVTDDKTGKETVVYERGRKSKGKGK